ncbi:fluoride efflux transporter FluC [Trueperella pyogenes]|uniref:fluoride efflux transporter FluC n=1 Tax=Trueperella pyogenes TaxID=1661 RepID=UPI00345D28BB
MIEAVCVALGGGIGAAARYGISRVIPKPWGTVTVNAIGSLILGVVAGVLLRGGTLPSQTATAYAFLGTGFCGGLTTFSTASLEAIQLHDADSKRRSVMFALGMAIGSVCCAAVGLICGGYITALFSPAN